MADEDFFASAGPSEPPRPEPRYRTPPWFGPPQGELAGVVPLELLLARSDTVAVAITGVRAFSTGFAFDLVTLSAPDFAGELDPFEFGHPHSRSDAGNGLR